MFPRSLIAAVILSVQVMTVTPAAAAYAPYAPPAPQQQTFASLPPVSRISDHIRGRRNARISVIEYSDFECPFCKMHHPVLMELMRAYRTKINWVYRHFPLSFHQNAEKEAEASECVAALSGNAAFWTFTDSIFARTESNGQGFALSNLPALAINVGTDAQKFSTCLAQDTYAKKVRDQMDAGTKAGVDGTPATFLVDHKTGKTKMISGAMPLQSFVDAVQGLLETGKAR